MTVLPSAGRLMASLRDIGYDLPSAVADLVDNTIDANARERRQSTLVADGPDSWIRVSDDGIGMTGASSTRRCATAATPTTSERALGHFGLGLKTASLSQCRRLTVASRGAERRPDRRSGAGTSTRSCERDSWDLERLRLATARGRLVEAHWPRRRHGTVVLWEKLDRVLAAPTDRRA